MRTAKSSAADVDMAKLRRRSLFTAWLIFLPLLVASFSAAFLPLVVIGGWPKNPVGQLSYKVYLAIATSGTIVANLPGMGFVKKKPITYNYKATVRSFKCKT